MAEPSSLAAQIEGGVSDQVAVGSYNLQIHADHGAIVQVSRPQPAPRLRPCPVFLRPRPVRGLVDRGEEIAEALAVVETALPLEIQGPPGIGKSTLLRHLANTAGTGALPDGIVHLSARGQPAGDLVQALFEAFYECDSPFKPTPVHARQLLQGRKALVLLDDCGLDREAAAELLDTALGCAFVLASEERCLWGEGKAIALTGLAGDDARTLFEHELGHPLPPGEAAAFDSLRTRVEGRPLSLLQAADQVRKGTSVAAALPADLAQSLALLPGGEKRILTALAALGGGPAGADHLAALADLPDPRPALGALLERHLVEAHSPRYSLTGDLAGLLGSAWDLAPARERALGYFTAWAEARRDQPAALLEEADVLRRLVDQAVEAGRHAEALRLGWALDSALTVSGRWGAWAQILQSLRTAAAALGDRATEAWTLHQLGSRLLCLDDKAGARDLLTRALGLRESLGDAAGAAVTRHNLGLLGPAPPSEPPGEAQPRPAPARLLPWIAVVLVVLGLALFLFLRPPGRGGGPADGTAPAVPVLTPEPVPPAPEEIPPAPEEIPGVPPSEGVPAGPRGWCCIPNLDPDRRTNQGTVAELTAAECRERYGTLFELHEEATEECNLPVEAIPPGGDHE